MAKDTSNGRPKTEMSVNLRALIAVGVRMTVRNMKDPTKSQSIPNNPSWNDSTNALIYNGMSEDMIYDILKANGGGNSTLSLNQWSEDAYKLVEKYAGTDKINQSDNSELILISIGAKFESWFKKEFPSDKRKTFKGESLKVDDYFKYSVAKQIETPKAVLSALSPLINKQKLGTLSFNTLKQMNDLMVA